MVGVTAAVVVEQPLGAAVREATLGMAVQETS
jgi:hypothetical protein